GETEVQGRADALRGEREEVPGGIAREEDTVLDRAPQLVRDPVSLVALGREPEVARQPDSRLLDVVRWPEGADANAQLVVGGKAPRVAGAHVADVDPQLHRIALTRRVDLQPARP